MQLTNPGRRSYLFPGNSRESLSGAEPGPAGLDAPPQAITVPGWQRAVVNHTECMWPRSGLQGRSSSTANTSNGFFTKMTCSVTKKIVDWKDKSLMTGPWYSSSINASRPQADLVDTCLLTGYSFSGIGCPPSARHTPPHRCCPGTAVIPICRAHLLARNPHASSDRCLGTSLTSDLFDLLGWFLGLAHLARRSLAPLCLSLPCQAWFLRNPLPRFPQTALHLTSYCCPGSRDKCVQRKTLL